MRTKTILLTAAVLAAGLSASVAQTVYSVNAVGYVNVAVAGAYTLIANPLNGTNNLLSTVIPAPPDGTIVLKWNATSQSFSQPFSFVDTVGWVPDGTINPGEGFFINTANQPTTLTFVGEVPQGAVLSNPISQNYTLMANIVPQSISLADASLTFPAQDGDFVLRWNSTTQRFGDPITFVPDAGGWLPSPPIPNVGEGFFFNTVNGARNWTRSFSVN